MVVNIHRCSAIILKVKMYFSFLNIQTEISLKGFYRIFKRKLTFQLDLLFGVALCLKQIFITKSMGYSR